MWWFGEAVVLGSLLLGFGLYVLYSTAWHRGWMAGFAADEWFENHTKNAKFMAYLDARYGALERQERSEE